MELYAIAGHAAEETEGGYNYWLCVSHCFAENRFEALKLAQEYIETELPPEHGWIRHDSTVSRMPQETA